jgi:hypothetical protein
LCQGGAQYKYPNKGEEENMAKFLAVHTIGTDFEPSDESTRKTKELRAAGSLDAYWIKSWYVRETGTLYCEWDAKNADAVRAVFAKAWPEFPIDTINPIEWTIHGEDYR